MTTTQASLDAIAPVVEREMARWTIPGIVVGVLRDGEVETRAWGIAKLTSGEPLRDDALFRVASISKVFTATLVMMLVDAGKLDLDRPVVAYLPDLRLADEGARATITLRQLLSHQSGLWGDFFIDRGMGEDALARAVTEFHTLRQVTAPGELWAYCNSGFHLTGRVIEQVLDQPFDQAMREQVFQPLGLERTCFFAHEAIAYPHAAGHNQVQPGADEHIVAPQYYPRNRLPAGGVISNAPDLLTFAAFHMGDGTVDGAAVLSADLLRAMQEPQVQAANFADEWGIGWDMRWIGGTKVVAHGGSINGFQTQLVFVPEQRVALAMLTNSGRGSSAIRGIERAALETYCGLHHEEPARVTGPADALARFAGRYRQPSAEMTVTVADGGLRAMVAMDDPTRKETLTLPPIPLAAVGEREFVVTAGEMAGSRVDFILSADSRVRFVRFGGRLADRVD
jgi:CubicO group peptidase (beta-lactamase class C family)